MFSPLFFFSLFSVILSYLPQIQEEVAKLLELKAKLEGDAAGGGKFVLKCPKVGLQSETRSWFMLDSTVTLRPHYVGIHSQPYRLRYGKYYRLNC